MAFGEFLGATLDIGKEFIGDVSSFAKDIGLEDLASLATAGVALSQLFTSQADVPGALSAGKATQQGALIASEQGTAPELVIGSQQDTANEKATQGGLRVRRTFDPGAGLAANPLAIQI